MAEPRPFPFERLPKVTRAEAASLQRAARRLPIGALARALEGAHAWLGAPLAIEPLPLEHCPRGELALCLGDPLCAAILEPAAPVQGARVAIEIEPRLAAIVIDRLLGGTGEDAPLDPGALSELERGVLAYGLARLLARAGGALRIVAVVTTPAALLHGLDAHDEGAMCWPARARVGADAGVVRAWIPERALARVDPAPIPGAHTSGLAALVLEVAIECGRATLSARDLGSLSIGDVVVLDESLARPATEGVRGEVRARIAGGATCWSCAIDGEKLVVRTIDSGRPAPVRVEGRKMDDDEQRAAALLKVAGDAPIELVVELARISMPLAELAALRPGEVLATGRGLGERVTLRAGDRTVALGELVEVEGEIGVRILAL